ncbi:lipopolysaccharide export system protein LptC [Shimia isoporae]|uniref:Lipopolysaccharide export system protein LptC n=1 Tax=Shimia isoporae TaxID=647720 RepID=A0A4R1N1E0_9RHOB|nr:LPS export ABC transporter periplasmic protein LptC [Shimia isoporae]TCK99938.1 lipopolysaccharide export system protein LptC [Shimia isoporae]
MASGNTYSQVVAFLKVVLPLIALGILATLFLVPREVDLEAAIPFAEVELEKRLRDQQVTAASFSTKTSSGHLVAVTASTAHPDFEDPTRTVATDLKARIDLANGQTINVVSDDGEMDSTFKEVVLTNNVQFVTSSGITMDTHEMTMSIDEVRAESSGEVVAYTQFGRLNAGRMAVRPAGNDDDIYLFFTNGVRLIYTPQKTTGDQ